VESIYYIKTQIEKVYTEEYCIS